MVSVILTQSQNVAASSATRLRTRASGSPEMASRSGTSSGRAALPKAAASAPRITSSASPCSKTRSIGNPAGFAGLRALCDQHGAYLIFDEVITGFGRLGTWFGAHFYDVQPDMITFAKSVTSGYQPLGGVLVGPAVHQPLAADPNFILRTGFTYSGHPTVCAAALKNIEIMQREGLVDRARHVGGRLKAGLAALAADGVIKPP